VANFSDTPHDYQMGAKKGDYTCIFDSAKGLVKDAKTIKTVSAKKDGRKDMLSVKLKPLCLYVFKYCP